MREGIPSEAVLFASFSPQLALPDPGSRHRGNAHSIAQEEDDILGLADVEGLEGERLLDGILRLLVPEVGICVE